MIRNILVAIPKNSNKIIFESNTDFTDSSRTLYEKIKDNPKYKFFWFVRHPENFKNTKNTKFLNINKRHSLINLYHILTSKYIFFTHQSFPLQNYKKQCVVNLTHGIGIKDSTGKLEKNFNYVLAGNKGLEEVTLRNHQCDKNVTLLSLRLPRNDLLFEKTKEVETLVSGYDKFILWLPTFRKHVNGAIDTTMFDDQTFPLFKDSELEELNKNLKEKNYLLILKPHPAQKIENEQMFTFSNIKILKNQDLDELNIQFYHLLGRADTILTDYSSVGNDYLLLDRPIGYVISDVEEYESSRGFYFENYEDYLPGEKIFTKEDFYHYLEDFHKGKDSYQKQRKQVRDFYWKYSDNKNCERILEYFNIKR